MKIVNLKASLHQMDVTLPDIDRPLELRQFVFCEIETDEGIVGAGITGQFLPWAVISTLRHHIFPLIKGMDPRNTEEIHARIGAKLNARAYTGVITNAMSAVDIALWDIRGKKENRTIAELMGGARTRAGAYVTFGYPFFDREELVHYAKKFADQGCNGLKMVVAQSEGGWREDAKRIQLVRDAIGPDVDLMIDANYLFTPHDALMLAREVEDCNLTWFEEPVIGNDARAMADLRKRTAIPISAGQMEGNLFRYRELIANHAVDMIQANCVFNGGYTPTLKVGHMAQAFNLMLENGAGWPHFNMHTMAGLSNGGRVEFHYGMWQAGKRFFKGAEDPDFKTNTITIPTAPGTGLTPDYDQLRDSEQKDPEAYMIAEMRDRVGRGH